MSVLKVIYDGDCGFCNRIVMFIAKKDENDKFMFISSVSEYGVELLDKLSISGLEKTSIILIDNNSFNIKTRALCLILRDLGCYRFLVPVILLFPFKFTDSIYDFIAKHRRKIINKSCEIPTSKIRSKFRL